MTWNFRIKDHKSDYKSEVVLDRRTVQIGRDSDSDVVLKHDRISRRHLELRALDDGRILAIDSSSNGSYVREDREWIRLSGEREVVMPCVLRLAHWTLKVKHTESPRRVVEEAQQTWDQSVMIPATNLSQQTEAILVFDLCESSLIASKDDHMAYHLKHRLSQIAEPILKRYDQRFFKSTGDGFLATFENPESALHAAIEVEDRIRYRNERTTNEAIHYRIAIHYGDVWAISTGGDDVHGHDVNVTFRIEGVQQNAFSEKKEQFPKRDRILCSRQFRDVVESQIEKLTSGCLDCGAAALKGIEEPTSIYWIKTKYSAEPQDSEFATPD